MPRTTNRVVFISKTLQSLQRAIQAVVSENQGLRRQLQGIAQQASRGMNGSVSRNVGRPPGRRSRSRTARPTPRNGGPGKRGRAFKFTDVQAAGLRKRAEGGESGVALAKELKVSVPTMYNTLKRAGWKGRRS